MNIKISKELPKIINSESHMIHINNALEDISSLLEPSYYHSTMHLKPINNHLVLDVKINTYVSEEEEPEVIVEVQKDILNQLESILDNYSYLKMACYINGYNTN